MKHLSLFDAVLETQRPLFATENLPHDARDVLEHFDELVQGVLPLSQKQQRRLPGDIHALSHALTDERGARRVGYMNDSAHLSAYVRYFSWWNLVRLTRLFANLPDTAFDCIDGTVCLDIGSGPLTVVCALWLARPELRAKKLTWYCMDISHRALAIGEDIYLSIAARTPPPVQKHTPAAGHFVACQSHWAIIRVQGGFGTEIKQKAAFITCANMFNELYEQTNDSPEYRAKKYGTMLLSYAHDNARLFVAEPGVPYNAHFISLLRDVFLRKKLAVIAPCPHHAPCPMHGTHARRGGSVKWCNFSFTTEAAPERLTKLSAAAQLGKYRAVLSFVFAERRTALLPAETVYPTETARDKASYTIRIASEPIVLGKQTGCYACSAAGLVLAVNKTRRVFCSGDEITVRPLHAHVLPQDAKTGAALLKIGE
ncbi:MAG: hypothetical protein IJ191_04760 [Treponema sp.]|nr:hypothetical protein [Treponema sp.]